MFATDFKIETGFETIRSGLKSESALENAGMRAAYALRTYPFPKENARFSKKTVEQKSQDGFFENFR